MWDVNSSDLVSFNFYVDQVFSEDEECLYNSVFKTTIKDYCCDFILYANSSELALTWLRHLLHLHIFMKSHPDVHGSLYSQGVKSLWDTSHLFASIENEKLKKAFAPLVIELFISSDHCDDVMQLNGFVKPCLADILDKNKSLSYVNGLSRIKRIFVQLAIFEVINELTSNISFVPASERDIGFINVFLGISCDHAAYTSHMLYTNRFISTILSRNADIEFYLEDINNPSGDLRLAIRNAREVFGESIQLWRHFWLLMLADPELFLLALDRVEDNVSLRSLRVVAGLMLGFENANIVDFNAIVVLANFKLESKLFLNFNQIFNKFAMPSNLLAVLRTRFLMVFVKFWYKNKELNAIGNCECHQQYMQVIDIMNREKIFSLNCNTKTYTYLANNEFPLHIPAVPRHPLVDNILNVTNSFISNVYSWFSRDTQEVCIRDASSAIGSEGAEFPSEIEFINGLTSVGDFIHDEDELINDRLTL